METKVKVYIKKNAVGMEKRHYVFLNVSRGRKGKFLLNTGLTTSVLFEGREFPKEERGSSAKTSKLNRLIFQTEEICFMNDDMPMGELKELIQEKVFGKKKPVKGFVDYCVEYADKCKTKGTAGLYMQTARKIESFDEDATFDTIDVAWLKRFESFCKETMGVNGMGILFRNIRTVFNQARKDGITDKYPFINYKIKKEETQKRNLSVEQIRLIRDCDCWNDTMKEYRDIFMLMIYLLGINAKDLLCAKKSQLVNGRLEYRRSKTGKLYSIKVEPEAMAIINRYSGSNDNLLNALDTVSDYHTYLQHMNSSLKHLGQPYNYHGGYDKSVEPIYGNLSSYYARHSWATIAAEIDVTFEVISAALGHSIANPTTAIYINFNQKKVDEANRRVIDYING